MYSPALHLDSGSGGSGFFRFNRLLRLFRLLLGRFTGFTRLKLGRSRFLPTWLILPSLHFRFVRFTAILRRTRLLFYPDPHQGGGKNEGEYVALDHLQENPLTSSVKSAGATNNKVLRGKVHPCLFTLPRQQVMEQTPTFSGFTSSLYKRRSGEQIEHPTVEIQAGKCRVQQLRN